MVGVPIFNVGSHDPRDHRVPIWTKRELALREVISAEEWNPSEDFNSLKEAGNTAPRGLWSDGNTMWVADETDNRIYAYDLETKRRVSGERHSPFVHAFSPIAITVTQRASGQMRPPSGLRTSVTIEFMLMIWRTAGGTEPRISTDWGLGYLHSPQGLWSDSNSMWATRSNSSVIPAYNLSDKTRDQSRDVHTSDVTGDRTSYRRLFGIWGTGNDIWVGDDIEDKLYAYNIAENSRDETREIGLIEVRGVTSNGNPAGIWSDGTTMWVVDSEEHKIYAYNVPGGESPTQPTTTCFNDVGTLSGEATRTGEWTGGCESEARSGSHAQFYAFTVDRESEVTITLESGDADAYLMLRGGNARSGGTRNDPEDDDDAGGGRNSQIQERLAAGTYTIEATTYDAGETGSFTLTVDIASTTPATGDCEENLGVLIREITRTGQWSSGCESDERSGSYARFYTFTLALGSEVTINLTSNDADTYLYLRSGNATSISYLYENDDHEGSRSRSQIQETLGFGTYTIEATTYDDAETGGFTLTVTDTGGTTPDAGDCLQNIAVEETAIGQWFSDCGSEARSGSYAQFYTFILDQQGEVTVTLESDDADTYLYLRSGNAQSGSHLYDNDDHDGSTSRSQIQETLEAGTYTIEATTYDEGETGSFTLTVVGPTGTTAPVPEDLCREALPANTFASRWAPGCESEGTPGQLWPLLHLHPRRGVGGDHHPNFRDRGRRPLPVPAVGDRSVGQPPVCERRP